VAVVDAAEGPALSIVAAGGKAHAIIWPGMGARLRSLHALSLEAGGETVMLQHPGEAVYYVIQGEGEVLDRSQDGTRRIAEGSMVHVEPRTPYSFRAGNGGIELVGGPAPPDRSLYES
jgi:mannose-6-phosphate isomerase-like protein (cupin superfamily)